MDGETKELVVAVVLLACAVVQLLCRLLDRQAARRWLENGAEPLPPPEPDELRRLEALAERLLAERGRRIQRP